MRFALVTVASITACMFVAAVARADNAPPALSGLWQYVESVPSAGGAKSESPAKRTRPLTTSERHALGNSSGAERQVLNDVAASPTYGAPATARKHARKQHNSKPRGQTQPRVVASPTAQSSSDTGVDPLVLILAVAIPLSFVAAAALRGRLRRRVRA